MTIALDTEVVSTRHDPKTGHGYYTIERNGKRWTAKVHDNEFSKVGTGPASITQRRAILARALEAAMRGPEDEP